MRNFPLLKFGLIQIKHVSKTIKHCFLWNCYLLWSTHLSFQPHRLGKPNCSAIRAFKGWIFSQRSNSLQTQNIIIPKSEATIFPNFKFGLTSLQNWHEFVMNLVQIVVYIRYLCLTFCCHRFDKVKMYLSIYVTVEL